MADVLHRRVPRAAWEVAAAAALVVGRAWALPPRELWRDWITILSLYWILAAVGSRRKSWPCLTAGVMMGLLVLYGVRQVPLTLSALGLAP